VYHLLFFHARPANQPTMTGVALRHKSFDVHGLTLHITCYSKIAVQNDIVLPGVEFPVPSSANFLVLAILSRLN
jgi:hypothetical protein